MYTLFSRILYRPVWIFLVLPAGSTFTYDLKLFFLPFFCSTKLLRVVGVADKSGSPWRLLRHSTGLLSSEKGLTSQHPESWKRHRKEDCEETDASVSAPWCQLSIWTMELNVSAAAVREPGSRRLLLPPPPPTTPSCFPRVRDATAPNSAGEVPIWSKFVLTRAGPIRAPVPHHLCHPCVKKSVSHTLSRGSSISFPECVRLSSRGRMW